MAIHQAPVENTLTRATTRLERRSPEPESAPECAPAARSASRRMFKVIRVANGEVLAEGTDTRVTIDVLTRVESIFDVLVYVWQSPAKAWRALTLGEQRTMWDFRARLQGQRTTSAG